LDYEMKSLLAVRLGENECWEAKEKTSLFKTKRFDWLGLMTADYQTDNMVKSWNGVSSSSLSWKTFTQGLKNIQDSWPAIIFLTIIS